MLAWPGVIPVLAPFFVHLPRRGCLRLADAGICRTAQWRDRRWCAVKRRACAWRRQDVDCTRAVAAARSAARIRHTRNGATSLPRVCGTGGMRLATRACRCRLRRCGTAVRAGRAPARVLRRGRRCCYRASFKSATTRPLGGGLAATLPAASGRCSEKYVAITAAASHSSLHLWRLTWLGWAGNIALAAWRRFAFRRQARRKQTRAQDERMARYRGVPFYGDAAYTYGGAAAVLAAGSATAFLRLA